jgi:hypothetical protein
MKKLQQILKHRKVILREKSASVSLGMYFGRSFTPPLKI